MFRTTGENWMLSNGQVAIIGTKVEYIVNLVVPVLLSLMHLKQNVCWDLKGVNY